MNDSDFAIGFKQGQEHGKQIILEKIEDIKVEIDEQYNWLMQTKHTLYDIDIAFSGIKSFIDKHIGGREDKE